MKKIVCLIISVIIVALMICALIPVNASAADDNDETQPEFLYVYINGTYLMYPALYSEGSAVIVYPCVHSCMKCGKCLLEDSCSSFDGIEFKCECEEPLAPVTSDASYSTDKDGVKIIRYDSILNAFSPYFSNVRMAIENRDIYDSYYMTFDHKDEYKVTLRIGHEAFEKLKAKRAEFWWVKETRRERIDDYVLNEETNEITFTADREGAYVVSSHLFNQALVEDAYFASEATCTEAKKYYLSCSCGASSENLDWTFTIGDPNGHDYYASETLTEAGCLTEGTFLKKCRNCDEAVEDVLPELGHSYMRTVLTVLPSETRDGEVKYFCKRCDAVYTEKIPRITSETDVSTVAQKPASNGAYIAVIMVLSVALVVNLTFVFVSRRRKRG